MKKFYRYAGLLFTMLMLGFTLVGCGAEKGNLSSGKVDLKLNIWDVNQKDAMVKMADAFMKENHDIKVDVVVTPWDQYWTKMQAAATGGNMADVVWMSPDTIYTYAEGNVLMDLSDKLKKDNFDLSKYPKNVTDSLNVDNKQLAIPKDNSTLGLWYNKDLFDAAGISYPDDTWTWDTWMDASKKLTNKDKGIYGMLAPANGQNFIYNLIWQNGSDFFTKDGKKSLYDSPKTIDAVKYGVSFIEKGYSPTIEELANTNENQFFESGKAAMITAGSWMANEYLSIKGLNVGVAPLPKNVERGSVSAGMGYAVAANTKHPKEAVKFVEFLGGKEANLIQSESGAAISAYAGTQESYVKKFPSIDAQVFVDAAQYGHSSYMVESRANWTKLESDTMISIFSGQVDAETGLKDLAKQINDIVAK